MIVGLTGGIGSGKTTVAKEFEKNGNVAVYFADEQAKKIMTTSRVIKTQLIKEFGEECYIDNQLNKELIASVVFSNPTKLKKLNSIVHPEVFKHFNEFVLANSDKEYILYENAILFENKSDSLCDIIISVFASEEIRIDRVIKRDEITKIEVINRINNQWRDIKKVLLSNYIILNSDNDDLENQIVRIHKKLTKKKALI